MEVERSLFRDTSTGNPLRHLTVEDHQHAVLYPKRYMCKIFLARVWLNYTLIMHKALPSHFSVCDIKKLGLPWV